MDLESLTIEQLIRLVSRSKLFKNDSVSEKELFSMSISRRPLELVCLAQSIVTSENLSLTEIEKMVAFKYSAL